MYSRVLLFLIITLSAALPAQAEKRIALVIGNGNYEKSGWELANPVPDAKRISGILDNLGFETTLVTDGTLSEMVGAFASHGKKLKDAGPDTIGLIYYAGHGTQAKGENYLIPVDATAGTQLLMEFQAPKLNQALSFLEEAGNNVNIVILDACRDNPLPAGTRSISQGLASVQRANGLLISFSTEPGNVALDGGGSHSPFAQALSEVLPNDGLIVEQVFKRVASQVSSATDGAQTPFYNSGLIGEDICFADCSGQKIVDNKGTTELENTIFDAAETACDYASFVDQFPNSPLATAAKRLSSDCTGRLIGGTRSTLIESGASPEQIAESVSAIPEGSTFSDALACVGSFAKAGLCTRERWSDMYLACRTHEHYFLDDGVLLETVNAGSCTAETWPNLARRFTLERDNWKEFRDRWSPSSGDVKGSLACVMAYNRAGSCDWRHWSEMYETCKTYEHPALDDGILLNAVKEEACTPENWRSLQSQMGFADLTQPCGSDHAEGVNGYSVSCAAVTNASFQKTGDKEWTEFEQNGVSFATFVETQRDEWSVYLRDDSRDMNLQIDLWRDKVSFSIGNEPKKDLYDVIASRP